MVLWRQSDEFDGQAPRGAQAQTEFTGYRPAREFATPQMFKKSRNIRPSHEARHLAMQQYFPPETQHRFQLAITIFDSAVLIHCDVPHGHRFGKEGKLFALLFKTAHLDLYILRVQLESAHLSFHRRGQCPMTIIARRRMSVGRACRFLSGNASSQRHYTFQKLDNLVRSRPSAAWSRKFKPRIPGRPSCNKVPEFSRLRQTKRGSSNPTMMTWRYSKARGFLPHGQSIRSSKFECRKQESKTRKPLKLKWLLASEPRDAPH